MTKNLLRVYVVDDQWPAVCEVLKEILPGDRFEVVAPADIPEGLAPQEQIEWYRGELSRRTDLDVVLLDVMFGGEPFGRGLIQLLYGMGYPTVVMSETSDIDELVKSAEMAGRSDFAFIRKYFLDEKNVTDLLKELDRQGDELWNNPPYFRGNLNQDESYSATYDSAELTSVSTLFAIRWENSIVIDLVGKVIDETARARGGSGVRILDIGCGTGRFEEVLLGQTFAGDIELVHGIDYCPGMLEKARTRLPREVLDSPKVRFDRRLGERLFLEEELEGRLFDVVLMGFGVPSFVKDVRAFQEVHRVLKPGGRALFTTYNRNAAVRRFQEVHGPESTDICAVIRQDAGRWQMGPDPFWIDFSYFTINEFLALLRSVGFVALRESDCWSTFPTLVTCTRPELLAKVAPAVPERVSYCDVDPFGIGFDEKLYAMDVDFCRVFRDQGYYINVVVQKER